MRPYFADHDVKLYQGDVLDIAQELAAASVNCVVTSPPYYGLRDYGIEGQIGLETSPSEYVETLRAVFAQVRRVLADDGTLWLNLGDSYAGSWGNQGNDPERDDLHVGVRGRGALPKGSRTGSRKAGEPGPKNLYGLPWRVAFALQDEGWTLRNAIIWNKPNAMPESVTDRLSTRYEHVFLFSKSRRYRFELDPIREPSASRRTGSTWRQRKAAGEPSRHGLAGRSAAGGKGDMAADPRGRNPGDVWTIPTSPYPSAHFATFPPELARRCILAGCPADGVVLDPFAGSGTTLMVARQLLRRSIGIELGASHCDQVIERLGHPVIDFGATG